MTAQKLPGTDAARHGTGDADLTIMLAAHRAFRRDLTRLARAAARPAGALRSEPARRRSVAAGWELFKRELHLHHTAEDEIIWPALRPRLAHSEHALSVLDAMEEEHSRIDPLLAAVDAAFAGAPEARDWPGEDRLADVIDELTSTLTGHLIHEERDGLPLIGVALTAAEWRRAGFRIARRNGLSTGGEMFAWILDDTAGYNTTGDGTAGDGAAGDGTAGDGTAGDGAAGDGAAGDGTAGDGGSREDAAATLASLPPPLRLIYRTIWKPRFDRTPRW
jgi:hemerythrin HHE cation binding domain-containing protein